MTTEDNFKTQAHKICQKNHLPLPVYTVQAVPGEPNNTFSATCEIIGPDGEKVVGPAQKGKSKNQAEHHAAMSTLEVFRQRYPEAKGLQTKPNQPPNPNKTQQAPKKKTTKSAPRDNTFGFIGKLNRIATREGFSRPKYEVSEASNGQSICICLLDTPDGELYATIRAKDNDTAKNAAAFKMLKTLDEDKKARELAQGIVRDDRLNKKVTQ